MVYSIKRYAKALGSGMLLCIILLSVCTGATIKTTAKRDSLSIAYYTFIGVHELTGHNDGAQVNKFQAATGNKTGDSWCASFVAFCLKLVGIKQIANGMARSWFDKAHTVWKLNVHGVKRFYELAGYKGNTGGFYFQSHHAIAHIFFIDAIKDDAVIIVSGNTNDAVSREGNCVAQAKVKIKSIHAVSNWIK